MLSFHLPARCGSRPKTCHIGETADCGMRINLPMISGVDECAYRSLANRRSPFCLTASVGLP